MHGERVKEHRKECCGALYLRMPGVDAALSGSSSTSAAVDRTPWESTAAAEQNRLRPGLLRLICRPGGSMPKEAGGLAELPEKIAAVFLRDNWSGTKEQRLKGGESFFAAFLKVCTFCMICQVRILQCSYAKSVLEKGTKIF